MKKRIASVSLLLLSVLTLELMPALASSIQSNTNKPSAKGEMKQGGKEAKNAGKSLGTDVKHGKVVKGGKDFGKHTGSSAKHVAKGTAKGTETAVKKTGNAAKETGSAAGTATKKTANAAGTAAKKTGNVAKKTGKAVKKTVTP